MRASIAIGCLLGFFFGMLLASLYIMSGSLDTIVELTRIERLTIMFFLLLATAVGGMIGLTAYDGFQARLISVNKNERRSGEDRRKQ